MISSKQLAKTLYALSQEDADQKKVLQKFLAFVQAHQLEGLLPSVVLELERVESEAEAEKALYVSTAHPLSPADEANIRAATGAGKSPLRTSLDKELLGGFRARYQGFEYEGSLGHTVEVLEKKLSEE